MGLDFIQKTNNRFITAERRNYTKQLGQKTLFSAAPHVFSRRYTCERNTQASSEISVGSGVFVLRLKEGFCIVSPDNASEKLGAICEGGNMELEAAFKDHPQATQALSATVVECGEIAPTFLVELDRPDDCENEGGKDEP